MSPEKPLTKSLSDRLRASRQALGVSQNTLAKILGVAQRTVSAYEIGTTQPPEEMVLALETRVAERGVALEGLPSLSAESPKLLGDSEFYSYLNRFLDVWKAWRLNRPEAADTCDFVVFGPERLPVFAEQRDQDLWSANLRNKINYHLFGVLDDVKRDALQDAFLTLRRIEVNAVKGNSPNEPVAKIFVHGIIADPGASKEALDIYAALANQSHPASTTVVIEPAVTIQERRLVRAIRLGGMPLLVARVRLDLKTHAVGPEAVAPSIFAARREENVSLIPQGPKVTGWLFLDTYTTRNLVDYVDEIIQEKTSDDYPAVGDAPPESRQGL